MHNATKGILVDYMVLERCPYGCTYRASPFTKKMNGFVGLRRIIYLVWFVFFLLPTKFGGPIPRIFPPKNLSIAKFHEPYKSFNYIMWYKTMINVLEDSKRCLKVLRMYEVPFSFRLHCYNM